MIILLDTGPLGLITHPRSKTSAQARRCNEWAQQVIERGDALVVPEIADYELRRELIRRDNAQSLVRLDRFREIGFLPINQETMLLAARLWAQARNDGTPTAHRKALDGDVILCAQANWLTENGAKDVVVATTNVKHISLFTDASLWDQV